MPTLNLSETSGLASSRRPRSAAIFILTQNQPLRVASLKTTLYFLFRHFNADRDGYRYPVFILHEGDFGYRDQEEVIAGIRSNCREGVKFVQLDSLDFTVPPHIDADRLRDCLNERPVPYWRSDRYRMMCRWWLVHFPRYAAGFDYAMRLDDDSFIEEPIDDPFAWAESKGVDYLSNVVHLDCGVCCLGLKHQFERLFPTRRMELDAMFVDQVLSVGDPMIERIQRLLSVSTIEPPSDFLTHRRLSMPVIFYNNFFVTRTAFWRRPEVVSAIEEIDRSGGIFYHRWGDAPIQTVLVRLLCAPQRVGRLEFRYSKRLQREAFVDEQGDRYLYAPASYV